MLPPLSALFSDPTRKELYEGTLLCLDPGETTGMCVLQCRGSSAPVLLEAGQLETKTAQKAFKSLPEVFKRISPTHVVVENYRVYGWKTEEHSNSEVVTARVIGMIELLCEERGILPTMQMAAQAKGFVDDDKLKAWNLWVKGKKHARDAIRHGVYYLLFTHTSKKERERQDAYRNQGTSEG